MQPTFLLFDHDTVECAYDLAPSYGPCLDYAKLAVEKEVMRASKSRGPTPVKLG